MTDFNILIVEDDEVTTDLYHDLLLRDAEDIAGKDRQIIIRKAKNQAEAEGAVEKAPLGDYDLVFLDLSYPRDEHDKGEDFYGPKWLPKLRTAQPDAAIIILTSHAYDDYMGRAVKALRDHGADEFIPKDLKWDKVKPRIAESLLHVRRERALRIATRPGRSNVSRTAAEDICSAVASAHSRLSEIADDLEGGDPSRVEQAPNAIRAEMKSLQGRLTRISSKLAGYQPKDPEEEGCAGLVRDLADHFAVQLRPRGGTVRVTLASDDLSALTYKEDLEVALREILQNAVDAALEAKGMTAPPNVHVSVERRNEYIILVVTDSGKGFPKAVVDRMFHPENSHWSERDPKRHSGMGLYVAQRMMTSIGGEIDAANNAEGHAEVKLFVRDWSRS